MKLLEIPHIGQVGQELRPFEMDSINCLLMCLKFAGFDPGVPRSGLSVEVYSIASKQPSRYHDPAMLSELAKRYAGSQHDYSNRATLEQIRKAIDEGKACFVHSWVVELGNCFVIRGYDETGFWVNDPRGEWTLNASDEDWYYTPANGQRLHYSNRMIAATCGARSLTQAKELYFNNLFDCNKLNTIRMHTIWR